MSLVALIGDCTTTTALALAAAWPIDLDVVVLEADRTGGSLAGWLDTPPTPSLTTLVAARGREAGGLRWPDVAHAIHDSGAGVRFLAAPVRAREAALAIAEAERGLIPMLGGLDSPTVLADVGRHAAADPLAGAVITASAVVALHRQDASSVGAEAVRLDRFVELLEQLGTARGGVVLGVIGDEPFEIAEIADYVASKTATAIAAAHSVAFDPLSASVLAGRSGVSAKRLARLPLARSMVPLTADLCSLDRPATVEAGR